METHTNTLQVLNDFIERALKNRKYTPNNAVNFRSPFKWIEPELNEEEKKSIAELSKNLDQIFNLVYNKNSTRISASSIQEYKRRMKILIADYDNYGKDSASMSNWNRPIPVIKPRSKQNKKIEENVLGREESTHDASLDAVLSKGVDITKHEESLSGGKAIVFTPTNLTLSDLKILRAYLDYLEIKIKSTQDNNKAG